MLLDVRNTDKKFNGVVVQMDETKVKIAFEKETKVFVIREWYFIYTFS